ncbi:hypothetical protein VKT23_020000 [Stygiomarasmius scandens]|uniref:Ribonuclease H1 N-terminal domain-containing protein n=1 Tax=Marasmiellus scandens TaxID=2682957 RepID=A0ABR1IP05_9AGAR
MSTLSSVNHDDSSLPSTTISASSSDNLWSDLEDLDDLMAQLPSHPCCSPRVYDSQSSGQGFRPKKWYLVLTGPGAGCYTTWADVSGRVIGVKGARHESYTSYNTALHAWRQNCLSKHQHPEDYVDGSLYTPSHPTVPPRAITPPPDTPVLTHARSAPSSPSTRPASTPAAVRTPGSPSRHRVARAFFSADSPSRQDAVPAPTRRWAVIANGVTGVFDAADGQLIP